MRDIIYDVAVSLDGYIAAPGGDASSFPQTGTHAEEYAKRLQTYDTVIMGRKTYEYGYQFGLPPGARAYPHMDHHIFSKSLELPDGPDRSDVQVVRDAWLNKVDALRAADGGPIYLCGGGMLAGYLLHHARITHLRLKIAPLILGGGIQLFENTARPGPARLVSSHSHKNGVLYAQYRLG